MRLVIIFLVSVAIAQGTSPGNYTPDWKSLDSRPLPPWYDEAKIGILIHWGLASVPALGNDWFWWNWKSTEEEDVVAFMKKNYPPGFTYQEFAEDFTGELFDADNWAKVIRDAGAKYVVLVSKHHDGFTLWPSTYTYSWNSVDLGPKRDILNELSFSLRNKTDIHFGIYYSLYEWYNPMYLKDKNSFWKSREYVDHKLWPELKEVIEKYKPEILWSDGDWEAPESYWNSKELIAWLYNESPVRQTVVTNDRWAISNWCQHGDFKNCRDRFNPRVLQSKKWENAMTIDRTSWTYREYASNDDYLSSEEIIYELVSTVSCGGNILINVGPTKAGTIAPTYLQRLKDMGQWLKTNGDAIYKTIPWRYQNDTTYDVWYTSKKPTKNGRQLVYATVLKYPHSTFNTVKFYTVRDFIDKDTTITLLGYEKRIVWAKLKNYVEVIFPSKNEIDQIGLSLAWTLKMDLIAYKEK